MFIGLISIFLDVECDKISCGLEPTLFPEFSNKTIIDKKVEILDLFHGKIIYVIKKVIKNYI